MDIVNIDSKTTIEDLLTLKKIQLVDFLRKHREKVSGSKNELATRVFNLNQLIHGADASIAEDSVKTSVPPDHIPCITELNTGWSSNEALFPKIGHKDVETYLINSRAGDSEKMGCYRQYIRGYNFFKEKYIHNIMVNVIADDSKYCYVRSKCYPSMKTGVYEQWVLVSKEKPFVVSKADCTCPAGCGEACTHISGLLFALEANSTKQAEIPCTSRGCVWNKTNKRKKEAKEVSEIKFKKLKYGEDSCGSSQNKKILLPETASDDFFISLTSKLDQSKSYPSLYDLLPNQNECYDINDEINVCHYEEVSTSEPVLFESDQYIDILNAITNKQFLDEQGVHDMLSNLTKNVIEEIEKRTIGQSDNPIWKLTRRFRITSSNFYDIINRKKENVEKLVSKFVDEDKKLETPALIYGRKHEKFARNKYKAYKKLHQNEKVSVRECGIVLSEEFGYLGASPDGLVSNKVEVCREWVLEIKCPYKWRYKTVKCACQDRDFCCEIDHEGLTCYNCYGIEHPRFCSHVTHCSADEVCGIKQIADEHTGELTYDIGCTSNKQCKTKRSQQSGLCTECCNTALCNFKGCGEPGFSDLNGTLCYNCQAASKEDNCHTVTTCDESEMCHIEEKYRFHEPFYTTGCMTKEICNTISEQPPVTVIGRRKRTRSHIRCCSSELCNDIISCAHKTNVQCPHGWIQFQNSCYFFSTETAIWSLAQNRCNAMDAVLVEVETQDELIFLRNKAIAEGYKVWWLGGNDIETEGRWIWASSKKAFTVTDWASGQPDNLGGQEDCVIISYGYSYQWDDNDCNDPGRTYICERNSTTLTKCTYDHRNN